MERKFAGIILLLGILLLYLVWTVVYNLFLHPLRKFPGSKLFAASYLPTAITRIYGVATHTILKFHDMYGPIVRVGPNEISYIDARALKDIYGHRTGGKEAFQKDSRFYGLDVSGAEGMFRAVDEDTHARQRRIFSHAFSEKALREQESIIKKYADKLTALLRQRAVLQHEAPIDILRMYNYTAFDIMGELAFSESLNLLEKDEYSPWVVAIFETFKFLAYTNVFKRYPPLDKLLLPSSVKSARAYHFANSVERCERRLASVSKKPDIWSFVVRAKEERNISKGEMYSNSSTLMTGGTETMSTLLAGLTFNLCKNPEKLQRLVREIRSFGSSDEFTMVNLSGLQYLNACIQESLRLYPPVPEGLPRIVPNGGVKICDVFVPAGSCVYYTHLAAYHSLRNFAEPSKYEPERWTPNASELFAKDNKAAMQPFSCGPRNCIGKNLAIHQARLIMASLLWNFDISLADKDEQWMDQKIFVQWDKRPLYIQLIPVAR